LAATPDVLLLDEPFAALDPALRREVRDAVVALLDANGPAVVVVTHDVDEAVQFAHRMAVLLPSGLAQVDAVATVLRRPASVAVARFLGLPNIVVGEVDDAGHFTSALGAVPTTAARGPATLVGAADALSARPCSEGTGVVESVQMRVQGSVLVVRCGAERLMATPAPGTTIAAGDRVALSVAADRVCSPKEHAIGLHAQPAGTRALPMFDDLLRRLRTCFARSPVRWGEGDADDRRSPHSSPGWRQHGRLCRAPTRGRWGCG
jgi:ABC-type sulfate/molybdate transport systems ATPase subunit